MAQQLTIPFLLILVISIISLPGIIFAESTETVNLYLTPDSMLVYGILIAGAATVSGIFITIADRRSAAQNRLQELIKLYSDEIREITNQESELDTKQACSLYVEQYLDTLEQIATLRTQKTFKDKAIEYFNNNFSYGMDLWWWYHKFIHGLEDDIQDKIWAATKRTKNLPTSPDFAITDLYPDGTPTGKEEEIQSALEHFLKDDRWPLFRKISVNEYITPFDYDYQGLGGKSADEWRVLPDLMYYDYESIADENGLTKAELVEIIRPFANDLADFVDDEHDIETPEQFEVYAEQYLETLEQIATLFRNKIIPEKAKEYFDNKFSYGCNLWEWYHNRTLKFSDELLNALWKTSSPKTRFEDVYTKEEIAAMSKDQQNEKKKLFENVQDTMFDNIKEETYSEFLHYYSAENKDTAITNLIHEDPDVWTFIKLAASDAKETGSTDFDDEIIKKVKSFKKFSEGKIENEANKVYALGRKLVELRTQKRSQVKIKQVSEKLEDAEIVLAGAIKKLPPPTDLDPEMIGLLFKEFIYHFLNNERWKDFRWWCKTEGITHFQEDKSEGLVLPLKMWKAVYK